MDGRKNDPDPNPTIYARLRMTSSDVGNITAIARQFHPALTFYICSKFCSSMAKFIKSKKIMISSLLWVKISPFIVKF